MTSEVAAAEVAPGAQFGPEGDKYEIGKQLGNGAASRVFACRRLNTGEELAVKAVDLRRLCLLGEMQEQLSRLDCEVGILHELRHERIVNLQGFHKTENWYFLVMELVGGGELFDVIVRNKSLSEMEARHIFMQLLEGVGYMHARGVIHRDLKPENILVASSRPEPKGGERYEVKIADFGLSKAIGGGASLARTRVGTPQYWAPEVLDVQKRGGSYDQAADFWGLGAVLFVMLCGRYPFDGQKQALDDQIRTASYSMSGSRWRGISEAAKSLVRGLLRVNPVDRLSLDDCLSHPWVTGQPMPLPKQQRLAPAVPVIGMRSLDLAQQADRAQMAVINEGEAVAREEGFTPKEAEDRAERAASTSCCSVDSDGKCSRAVSELRESQSQGALRTAAPLLAAAISLRIAGKEIRFGRWRWVLLMILAVALYWRPPLRGKLVLEGMPGLQRPEHFSSNLSVEGEDPHFLAPLDVQTPFFYLAGVDRAPEKLLLEASEDAYQKQKSLFRLSELLKLQISIAGSLEMANLAVRHVDSELAESTRSAYQQARELFKRAAEVVSRYAEVAGQVSHSVLPDLRLAVDEQEPAFAESLLEMVRKWVTDMKKDSDVIRANYGELQSTIVSLADRALRSKQEADVKLAQAVATAAREAMVPAEKNSTKTGCTLDQQPQFQVATRDPPGPEVEVIVEDSAESWASIDSSVAQWLPTSSGIASGFNSTDYMALVPYQPSYDAKDAKAAAERAASSSKQLLRALHELRRVDSILEGCYVFWANMDGTVQKLGQMKEHAERLVNFAGSTPKLRQRFEQRMKEYGDFWTDLERLCRQYSSDHHAASAKMREVVREVSFAADVRDTHESAYAGARAGNAARSSGAFAGHDAAASTGDFPSESA